MATKNSSGSGRAKRRKFTPEFRAEAVAMVAESGGNVSKFAKELGLDDTTLGNWVRRAVEEAAGAPTVEERAEIRELERELERVKRERDTLGRNWAAGWLPTSR